MQHKEKLIAENERLHAEFSQTLLQAQLEIQEQTMQHISYELHDNLGQIASLIKINLTTLQFDDLNSARERVEDTRELVRQLIGGIKALSVSMGGDRLQKSGLSDALAHEVLRINKIGSFHVSYQAPESLPPIDSSITLILYRMAQEAINNMIKHSGAAQLRVGLSYSDNLVKLELADNGIGFDIQAVSGKDGAGLNNLQKRAKLIHANLDIQSQPGMGTKISLTLPLSAKHATELTSHQVGPG